MIKRFIIRGVSKKFKGVQKLPAQKTPKFKPDAGEAAIKQFTKKFGDKPQFMGFSERAGVSMAAESLASKTAERSFIKTLTKNLSRSRTITARGIKGMSMYDGLKPFLRFKGDTISKFVPTLGEEAYFSCKKII